jgi:hypothetical protein
MGNVYMWVVIALTLIMALGHGYYAFVRGAIEEPVVVPKHA